MHTANPFKVWRWFLVALCTLLIFDAAAQSPSAPHKIERDSSAGVILYLWAASVGFSEYRGMQLGEDGGETKFDAALIPNDWAQTPECSISQKPYEAGMLYTYLCDATFPLLSDAIKARDDIVARYLGQLNAFIASVGGKSDLKAVVEDEVREHGLRASAKKNVGCSPEHCLFEHVYATNQVFGRILQISADPVFTVSALAAAKAKREGKPFPFPVSGETGEGRLSITMLSVGPPLKAKH